MEQEILTMTQVAELFQVHKATIKRWMQKDMPYSNDDNGAHRFLKEECVDWKFKKGKYSPVKIKMPKEIENRGFICGGLKCSAEKVDCIGCCFYSDENFNEFIKQCGL